MFDRVVQVEALASGVPLRLELAASSEDCERLAERFGWMSVEWLTARLELRGIAHGAYQVRGVIEAELTQACRITDAAVSESLFIEVDERFAEGGLSASEAEIDPMAVSVEAIADGRIMLGEMVAQLAGLEASAWPRATKVTPASTAAAPDARDVEAFTYKSENDSTKPLAMLAELKKKR